MNDFKYLTDNIIDLKMTLKLNGNNPACYYQIFEHNTNNLIGYCGVRFGENEELYYLGNIEYEILNEYRGNNYAVKASILLKQIADALNIKDLKITCNPDNIASVKTIEKLGCKFIEIAKIPKGHKLYKKGERLVAVYNLNLNERENEYDRHKSN